MQPVFPNSDDAWDAVPAVAVPLDNQPWASQPRTAQSQPFVTPSGSAGQGQPFVPRADNFAAAGNFASPSNASVVQTPNPGNIGGPIGTFFSSAPNQAMANAGLNIGREFLQNNVRTMTSSATSSLKYYFNVDNSYVINKLRILLFPYAHKRWDREFAEPDMNDQNAHGHGRMKSPNAHPYKPPCRDVMAPDLYIPTMALVTYVLLMGYSHATSGQFNPEYLATTTSWALACVVGEYLVLRVAFVFSNVTSPNTLDLFAYLSYKFVGMIVDISIGFMLGRYIFWLVTAFFALSSAFVMVRTLSKATSSTIETTQSYQGGSTGRTAILLIGALQIVSICYLLKE